MTVLEILRRARVTITDGEFEFSHWGTCTCGHIYAAEVDETPTRFSPTGDYVLSSDRYYPISTSPVIREVATLLGWDDTEVYRPDPAVYISDLTRKDGTRLTPGSRDEALRVIDLAIKHIETQQEADRLEVVDEALAAV